MTFPANPNERSPKGDHNRRLSLGISADEFAATAGVSSEALRHYEFANVDDAPDPDVAERVGRALERLEASVRPKVNNGDVPQLDTTAGRVDAVLRSQSFLERLAVADAESAEHLILHELLTIDPTLQLKSFGERARGPVHELLVRWAERDSAEDHEEVLVLPVRN
jgi:transcriptional regulator with XRE-family HTH domain